MYVVFSGAFRCSHWPCSYNWPVHVEGHSNSTAVPKPDTSPRLAVRCDLVHENHKQNQWQDIPCTTDVWKRWVEIMVLHHWWGLECSWEVRDEIRHKNKHIAHRKKKFARISQSMLNDSENTLLKNSLLSKLSNFISKEMVELRKAKEMNDRLDLEIRALRSRVRSLDAEKSSLQQLVRLIHLRLYYILVHIHYQPLIWGRVAGGC